MKMGVAVLVDHGTSLWMCRHKTARNWPVLFEMVGPGQASLVTWHGSGLMKKNVQLKSLITSYFIPQQHLCHSALNHVNWQRATLQHLANFSIF